MMLEAVHAPARLFRLRDDCVAWLRDRAYPLWSRAGVDPASGAFVEAIGQDGTPLAEPRRARVTPRQVYAFANAVNFGWAGDARALIERAWQAYDPLYRRTDGLYRTLVSPAGQPLDERALLYDQAFVLLAMASFARAGEGDWERRAAELLERLDRSLAAPPAGYLSEPGQTDRRASNPHMHLLEACLAWSSLQPAGTWAARSDALARLALERLRKPDGVILEHFDADWRPAAGRDGRLYEPGHQFEWAWLLLRSARPGDHVRRAVALRLIDDAEQAGVHDNFVVNALLDDGSLVDANARLWPQTERLKAALLAATLTGQSRYWTTAERAVDAVLAFLDTRVPGLWWDVRRADGSIAEGPAPASTFYHLVCAFDELDATLGRRTGRPAS